MTIVAFEEYRAKADEEAAKTDGLSVARACCSSRYGKCARSEPATRRSSRC